MDRIIVRGRARGPVLKSEEPINFLGAIDKKTGHVQDGSHPLHRRSVGGSVLVFPHGIGSSVGAYVIYSLKSNGVAPAAMVCKKADLTVATGCALADIPLVLVDDDHFSLLPDGQQVAVDTDSADLLLPL